MKSPLCDDKSLLMGYLYGECSAAERKLVEDHLAGCATCVSELNELRGVRVTLRDWAPPDQALGFRVVRDEVSAARDGERPFRVIRPRLARWMPARLPAWAQAAAAVLVLALGAGIANLDVRVGNGGVTIRTGWHQAAQAPVPAQRAPAATTVSRADLAALEQQLRQEIASIAAVATTPAGGGAPAAAMKSVSSTSSHVSPEQTAAILTRVQTLVDNMERRKQHDFDQQLAERFLRFTRDINSQRAADLRAIQQGINQVDMRTTELNRVQNYMLRVANVQEIK